jgi:hypothetical protein
MIDFGLDPSGKSKPVLLRDLAQYLVDQRLAGRMVLLVIDEAQNLSLAALEELRMLSNLETEKSKLLQIVLVGQPNLRDKLAAPELEQLRQRITVSYHLQPLEAQETENYINHRLRRAALGAPLEFPREVTAVIHARSRGVPRIINVICDATLVFGYAEERRQIDLPLMSDVLVELEATGVLPAGAPVPPGAELPESVLAPAAAPPVRLAAVRSSGSARAAAAAPATAIVQAFDASPRAADVLSGRTAELEQREQAVRQRERELAEQRRILAEEYRLLRTRTQPATPAGRAVRVQVTSPRHTATAYGPARHESLWSRLKRLMLGLNAPATDS